MHMLVEGRQTINGRVSVSGAKNSATRILAAALLSDGEVILRNFPLLLEDARAKMNFIEGMGASILGDESNSSLRIVVPELSSENLSSFDLPIRTTYLLASSQIMRNGYARIPYPGGCKIGSRGYDLHLMVWREFGCEVTECSDYIEVRGNLVGATIDFPISTVGGTENALMCAAVAHGKTDIKNAYVTPEVLDLIYFLREMGAVIELNGSSHIVVNGSRGALNGASYSIMPDRIEALTWIVLALATRGNVIVENVPFDTMEVPLIHLRDAGVDLYRSKNSVIINADSISKHGIQPFELATGTHPGVISDMQSFFVFLGMFANGRSTVFDYRYPERIAYAHELAKFVSSGSIDATLGKIITNGPVTLRGAHVQSTDLRGSMAQIMAAICADGTSRVDGVKLALRGYNDLPTKLSNLGVEAQWIS